ncbi:MAG: hypothetical protein NVS3B20_12390 [Polyangiales bacterium]
MKQVPLRLLLVAALTALPSMAFAQAKKKATPAKVAPAKGDKGKAAGAKPTAPVEDLGGDDTTVSPTAAPDADAKNDTKPASAADSTAGGGASFICQANPEACNQDELIRKYAEKDLKDSQVYAVQQIYALRKHRFEFSPYWGVSLNDQFVSHPGPGLAVNYYVSNVLAVGLNFNYYAPFNSDAEFNKLVRQSTRLAVPITEYQYGANLNFTYVPLYGKFAGFGKFIFHWDGFVVGGVGGISTRPKAVIDPENRAFKYKAKVAINAGLGFRVFFNRWLAAFLEVRDYAYSEPLENTVVADPTKTGTGSVKDSKTWFGESRFTNAIQAQFGLSIFLPFTWQYKLPK